MNPQYSSSFNNYHLSLSPIFLKNPVQFSYTISHVLNFSVSFILLLFPGPRRSINSGYTFGLLHHMRRHMRVVSVLALVLFNWLRGKYLSPLKYVFPFAIITESRVTFLQHGYKAKHFKIHYLITTL